MLSGECTLIVEEQERPLRQWDYFHCPADTSHVMVGDGDGPCAILMIGSRPDERILYPVSELAAKYGASAAKETDVPDEAYADLARASTSRCGCRGRPMPERLEPALPAEEADHRDEDGDERGDDHPERLTRALAREGDVHAEHAREHRQRQHDDGEHGQ